MSRARIVVLISGSGSNLQALIDAGREQGDLGGDLVGVLSDRADVKGLARAAAAGIPGITVLPADFADRQAWERGLIEAVDALAPDLVVLAGFMKILSADFVTRWPTVNVHPSLLPAFPGARAPEEAVAWGVKLSGVTVHYVDEKVDNGPIIAQQAVPVEPDDTADTLHARIQRVEHQLLPDAVRAICQGRVTTDGRTVRISS